MSEFETNPAGIAVCTSRFDTVFHVGTLDATERAQRFSQEGSCLSVSRHPEDWRMIARLGQSPTWALDTSALVFLDALALDAADHDALTAWAIACGLIVAVDGATFEWFDDEAGCVTRTWSDDPDEIDEWRDEDPAAVTSTVGHRATPALAEALGRPVLSGTESDMALIVYVDRHLPDVDGIWWDERHDPMALSCPRGGILPRSLNRAPRRIVDPSDA